MRPLLDLFRPGRTIYLPGASGEMMALANALAAEPDRMRGVHLVSCPLPGINSFDYAALDPTGRMTLFLLPEPLRPSFERGNIRVLPLPYTGVAAYLGGRLRIDVAIAHVAPPDAEGRCSLGIAADFTPLVWRHAKIRALIVNEAMPSIKRGPRLPLAEADVAVMVDEPLLEAPAPRIDPCLDIIAGHVANLVPDGAAIQLGLGGAPGAVWPRLTEHRELTIASGLVAEGAVLLAESGALRSDGQHRAGVAFGSPSFHRFLAEEDIVAFATVPETHGAEILAATNCFTAINSALEIDLFGQANLEFQAGRLISGVGGAPDFARGALGSPGGRSIIALPSTAKGGSISRIGARLDAPAVSLGRGEIDTVVTEHGVAQLRDCSLDERAAALIAIAAPAWRDHLASEWAVVRSRL